MDAQRRNSVLGGAKMKRQENQEDREKFFD
jgi:hypothetical protein